MRIIKLPEGRRATILDYIVAQLISDHLGPTGAEQLTEAGYRMYRDRFACAFQSGARSYKQDYFRNLGIEEDDPDVAVDSTPEFLREVSSKIFERSPDQTGMDQGHAEELLRTASVLEEIFGDQNIAY